MSCPEPNLLAEVASLHGAERAAIADHAAACPECRALLSDLLGVPVKGSFAMAETLASATLERGIPPRIDRYEIERRLGAGAMGVVYRAHDPELARLVAVKVLRLGGSADRMKREAQALAKLHHPNIVAVHDVGTHEGSTFVTMALVDGSNLRTWLETPRTTRAIVDAIAQAARGLEAAHAAGIVHRDIKPDNLFVASDGTVLVGDFGLARTEERADPVGEAAPGSELTQTGTVMGTPAYMAPEQFEGDAGAASDQFALCVTAWEALCGTRPFTGQSIAELAAAVKEGPPPWRSERSVPAHVRAAIRRGLSADPAARHPSMTAFIRALGRRRWWPLAAGAVAVVVAAVVLFAWTREDAEATCDAIEAPAYTVPPGLRPAAAKALDEILARYTRDWHALARSSCRAVARRELSAPSYTATRRCLELRADALTWIAAQPDDPLHLAEALEPIETCTDISEAAPSPELAALQRDLSRASVAIGHEPAKAKGVDGLVARATALNDAGALAVAHYLHALVEQARGADPTRSLRSAVTSAERARDDRIRTRASSLLAIAAARAGRLAEAAMLRDGASSAATRATDPVSAIAVERVAVELATLQQDSAAQIAAYQRIETHLIARFGDLSHSLLDVEILHAGELVRRNHPDGPPRLQRALARLIELNGDDPAITLERQTMTEQNPAIRLPLQERLVAMIRRYATGATPADRQTFVKEVEVLAYNYELVGRWDRALETMREAIELETPVPDVRLETAAYYAFEVADRTDSEAIRKRELAAGLALIDRLPATVRDHPRVQSIRGRILLRMGRLEEALAPLTTALAAAERTEPQDPLPIGIRAFALAEALWQVGGTRERERAIALAEQAARRLPEVRAQLATIQAGALVPRVDELLARIETWRRAHR